MHSSKIILIGYRATGKSTVGRLLAERLSFAFIDMDKVIENRERGSILALVAQKGWDYFRLREKQLLEELATNEQRLVVATGGGAVLHQDVWPKIKTAGMVVWLKADKDTICQRLAADQKTSSQRPPLTGTDTESEVGKVLAEREPLYKTSSHFSVDTAAMDVAAIAAYIEQKTTLF